MERPHRGLDGQEGEQAARPHTGHDSAASAGEGPNRQSGRYRRVRAGAPSEGIDAPLDGTAAPRGAVPLLRRWMHTETHATRLEALCARRIRARALLVDPGHLHSRAMLQILRSSEMGECEPPPGSWEWIEARVDEALDEILLDNAGPQGVEAASTEAGESTHAFLARAFGIEPAQARAAAARFNALPERTRRAFFVLLLEGGSVEASASAAATQDELEQAFRALSLLPRPSPKDGGT